MTSALCCFLCSTTPPTETSTPPSPKTARQVTPESLQAATTASSTPLVNTGIKENSFTKQPKSIKENDETLSTIFNAVYVQ